ncbi:hypothetical protein AGR7B_Lc100025 [Agrobacterium deltaense RV3]|nr:hypothetical protein AGR7B_Lc100025 [Agrobacterium deltaense RV3]
MQGEVRIYCFESLAAFGADDVSPSARSGIDVLPETGYASDPSRQDQGADRLQTPPRHLWW